jgi:hypothetical protein
MMCKCSYPHVSGWVCSLPAGHPGQHQAHDNHNLSKEPTYVWLNMRTVLKQPLHTCPLRAP